MNQVNDKEMLAVRMEIAVGICTKFPNLYMKLHSWRCGIVTRTEEPAANVLSGLMQVEPLIRKVLDAYYQPEIRKVLEEIRCMISDS